MGGGAGLYGEFDALGETDSQDPDNCMRGQSPFGGRVLVV
jgi:hypothetical protein